MTTVNHTFFHTARIIVERDLIDYQQRAAPSTLLPPAVAVTPPSILWGRPNAQTNARIANELHFYANPSLSVCDRFCVQG